MTSLSHHYLIILTTAIYLSIALDDKSDEYVTIYSSCDPNPNSKIHKNNGLYYIKPLPNGPVIAAICSNGYTMIDGSLDLNLESLPSYLTSYDYSRVSMDYIITNLDDTSTFREWWKPSDKYTKFRVAKNCKSCESATDSTDTDLTDNVVYYTDSSLFCYTWFNGNNPCSENINEYSCNVCDNGKFGQYNDDQHDPNDPSSKYWTQCSALQVSSDTPSLHEPQMRVNHHLIYRPVISMIRDQCTCYQPRQLFPEQYNVLKTELPKVTVGANSVIHAVDHIDDNIIFDIISDDDDADDEQQPETDRNDPENAGNTEGCDDRVVYLTQNDFKYGTYRIRKCGEYILTEDITLNFNGPSVEEESDPNFSPNRIDGDLYWFPTRQQANHEDEYPGLYDYVGSYSLGFFAGITIESNNVIINLNGYKFGMNYKFYLQQRFFSLIEMASKQFEPLQGPSSWGLKNEFYAENVEIKGPGILDLTSHHAIHGNKANNIYIHDLDISHFDVAGIACNGCTFVTIEDIIIGPQNNDIPTLGRYTHSRAFLPRLQHLNAKFGHEMIQFYGREEIAVSELCKRLITQMDMIYHHVINDRIYSEDDEQWIAAQKLFKNPSGWMDGGTSYGLVINGVGAAVVGIGARVDRTNDININNVEIFGIYNKAIEKIKFALPSGTTRGILFDAIDWLEVTDQVEDRSKTQYIGDAYTDIQFAAAKFVDSWYYRNSYFVAPQEIDFVFKGNTEESGYPFLEIFPPREDYWNDPLYWGCGTDIQLHSNKGAIGMMINGAQDSQFDNIYIHDIYNWADLGMEICGPYPGPHLTIEDIDIQYGYTGTRAHGLIMDYTSGDYTNIKIENIESYHGEANGITIYKESYVNLENIQINNIQAGSNLNEDSVKELVLPNLVPKACAMDIKDNTEVNYLKGDDVDNLIFDGIQGFIKCGDVTVSRDQNQIPVLTIIFGLILMVLFCIILCVAYKVVRHICCELPSGNIKVGEQTPLLGI